MKAEAFPDNRSGVQGNPGKGSRGKRQECEPAAACADAVARRVQAIGAMPSYPGISVRVWVGRASDRRKLLSCHALLQYELYKYIPCRAVKAISGRSHSIGMGWSSMAQVKNPGMSK